MSGGPNDIPIELILSANDYKCECMMIVINGCGEPAKGLIYTSHASGKECGKSVMPLCDAHGGITILGLTGSPLLAMMGVPPVPPCETCGEPIVLVKATDLKGNPVMGDHW